jgi:hypothetical protein
MKIKTKLTEVNAFKLEITLIESIGKRVDSKGPLCNYSNGGEGVSGGNSPRFKVCVYNNCGKLIDTLDSVKNTSSKYKISAITIYKHCRGESILPSDGFRFRKKDNNLKKLCNYDEIEIKKKGRHLKPNKGSKKVYRYTIEGMLLGEYINSNIASIELNVSRSAIQNNLTGRSKTCNNNVFKYN